jgi:hypothetical protein
MQILDFIIKNPTYAIILILVILLFIKDIGIKNIFIALKLIRGTQNEKYPALKDDHIEIMQELHNQNKVLAQQNEKFATNHMMHEIPDIKKDVTDIKKALNGVVEIQRTQGLDIATLLERSKK